MADEGHQKARFAVNLDLPSSTFDALKEHPDLIGSAGPANILPCSSDLQGASDGLPADLEVVFFVPRQLDRGSDAVRNIERGIREACQRICGSLGEAVVDRVILVDCGDSYMEPLSDISILVRYLEIVSDVLETRLESAVFAADQDADEDDFSFTIRDTRSETFIDHMASFTRLALKVLNNEPSAATLPDSRTGEAGALEASVEEVLERSDPTGAVAKTSDDGKVHWLRRAV